MSGHGAQPRSNQGWFLWREENRRTRRKTLEAQERTNKLNSHMIQGPGIEPGTIVVRGERSRRCATRAPLNEVTSVIDTQQQCTYIMTSWSSSSLWSRITLWGEMSTKWDIYVKLTTLQFTVSPAVSIHWAKQTKSQCNLLVGRPSSTDKRRSCV